MKKKLIALFLITFITLINLPISAFGKDKVTIRVGHFPNITHAQALYGFSNGTFQKALGNDVNIDRKVFNAGPAEIEALLAGELDLGYIGPVPAINGFSKTHGELKIVAGAVNAGAVLVVRKDANIKSVKDLAKKKVAVPQFGNTQDISLRNILKNAGLKPTTKGGNVEVLQVENPDILTLFVKKELDAALVPEPWGSRLVKDADAKILLDYKQVWRNGDYTTAVVIVSKKFLKEHPDLVEKWLKAHVEITDTIKKNPAAAKKAVNDQIKDLTGKNIPDDILNSAYARIIPTVNPSKASIEEFIKISKDVGYLKDSPKVKDLVDVTILNKILKAKKQPLIK